MRINANVPDDLVAAVRAAAEERRMPASELVEEALRTYLAGPSKAKKFLLADGSFKGELGLREDFDLNDWATIRAMTYSGQEPW